MGREAVDGRDAYKLKLTLKSGTERYEYVDAKTFYRLRTDTTRQIKGRSVRLQIAFGDYRKTAGTLFPHVIDVSAEGRPQHLHVVVNTVEVNLPMSDAQFQQPAVSQP